VSGRLTEHLGSIKGKESRGSDQWGSDFLSILCTQSLVDTVAPCQLKDNSVLQILFYSAFDARFSIVEDLKTSKHRITSLSTREWTHLFGGNGPKILRLHKAFGTIDPGWRVHLALCIIIPTPSMDQFAKLHKTFYPQELISRNLQRSQILNVWNTWWQNAYNRCIGYRPAQKHCMSDISQLVMSSASIFKKGQTILQWTVSSCESIMCRRRFHVSIFKTAGQKNTHECMTCMLSGSYLIDTMKPRTLWK
jgi:hypothetical protein